MVRVNLSVDNQPVIAMEYKEKRAKRDRALQSAGVSVQYYRLGSTKTLDWPRFYWSFGAQGFRVRRSMSKNSRKVISGPLSRRAEGLFEGNVAPSSR